MIERIILSESIFDDFIQYQVIIKGHSKNLYVDSSLLDISFSASIIPLEGHYLVFNKNRNPIKVKHTKEDAMRCAYEMALEKAKTWIEIEKHRRKHIEISFEDNTSMANNL
jgi:hypothetical protein